MLLRGRSSIELYVAALEAAVARRADPYVDDAVHSKRHRWSRKTLCGLPAKPRNVLPVGQVGDFCGGCWTCRNEFVKQRVNRPGAYVKLSRTTRREP